MTMSKTAAGMEEMAGCPRHAGTFALDGSESRLDPLIRNNPFPFYRALRGQEPVFYDAKVDVYFVSRFQDAMTVMLDNEVFSLEHGYQDRWGGGFVDELAQIMDREGGGFIRDPVFDPPAHTRHRRLLEKAFTAHRVKTLEPRIRQIVIENLESLADQGFGDGIHDIGAPLTARIMCEQLGLDFEQVGTQRLVQWTHALFAQMGRMQTHEDMLGNAKLICELQNYLIPVIRARETEPREDMISDLVHARLAGEENPTLSFREKLGWVRALLTAGNDTTTAAIANVAMTLALQPELALRLYDSIDDDRLFTRFVEEILRIQPPVHGLFRCTTRAVELGGKTIPPNAHVCVVFASANRDDSVFPNPEHLDFERKNPLAHMTFGAGIHRCIGASLSRMEIKVAAQEIVRRLDRIRLAIEPDEITYVPNLAMHVLEKLPLTFARRQAG
jgi:cytochrome P450